MIPSITILIPTYNRVRALEAVWPSYLVHPDVARIVVIDDGSTDGTSDRVRGLAKSAHIPVDVIRHESQQGQPASRMAGIAAAKTDWVLFGEEDVWLAPDYCSTLLREGSLSTERRRRSSSCSRPARATVATISRPSRPAISAGSTPRLLARTASP